MHKRRARVPRRHALQEEVIHQARVRPAPRQAKRSLQTQIRKVQRTGPAAAHRDERVQHRDDARQLLGCGSGRQQRLQVGGEAHARVVVQSELAVEALGRLVAALEREDAGRHEEEVERRFPRGDVRAGLVDVLEERDVGLKEVGLRGGVGGLEGGDGAVCGGLAAADEVDLGGRGVAGQGEGCGEGDARGAADWKMSAYWR